MICKLDRVATIIRRSHWWDTLEKPKESGYVIYGKILCEFNGKNIMMYISTAKADGRTILFSHDKKTKKILFTTTDHAPNYYDENVGTTTLPGLVKALRGKGAVKRYKIINGQDDKALLVRRARTI